MEQSITSARTTRKTYKAQLKPTPAQERALEEVLRCCRLLYNCTLEQRLTWWHHGQGRSVSRHQQVAELKDLSAASPEVPALHSPVLQAVLARLARTDQTFLQRLQEGEQASVPRSQGLDGNRSHSFPDKPYGTGAQADHAALARSKRGRLAVRRSRPVAGAMQTVSREADGWDSRVPARACPPRSRCLPMSIHLVGWRATTTRTRPETMTGAGCAFGGAGMPAAVNREPAAS